MEYRKVIVCICLLRWSWRRLQRHHHPPGMLSFQRHTRGGFRQSLYIPHPHPSVCPVRLPLLSCSAPKNVCACFLSTDGLNCPECQMSYWCLYCQKSYGLFPSHALGSDFTCSRKVKWLGTAASWILIMHPSVSKLQNQVGLHRMTLHTFLLAERGNQE